jgi:hypothetical protein
MPSWWKTSSRMARVFLGPDVRGTADLVLRHVRFFIVKSFGLNVYRTGVKAVEQSSRFRGRATYFAPFG